MATFYFDGDSLQQCPYNPYHRVLSRRLLSHISKCAEHPSSPKLLECPFNALHRVYPDEFNTHVVECRDNRQTIREMLNPIDPTSKLPSSSASSVTSQPLVDNTDDAWETDTRAKEYILPGLEDNNPEEVDADCFISQQKLYNLKPAERKRMYNQLTENVIKRQAQRERQELTAEEAQELGFEVKPKVEFIIDPKGEPSTSREERNNTEEEEDSTLPKRRRISDEPCTDPRTLNQNIKRPPDDDEEDNKEHIKKLIRQSEPGCFRSRPAERRRPM